LGRIVAELPDVDHTVAIEVRKETEDSVLAGAAGSAQHCAHT
jgi:hypothetical protein